MSEAPSPTKPNSPSKVRPHRSPEQGRALVSRWQASGLSMSAYAVRMGIPKQRIGYWRKRLGSVDQPVAEAGFVEIAQAAPAPGGVVVEVASARIRVDPGFDPALLSAVVSALSRAGVRC